MVNDDERWRRQLYDADYALMFRESSGAARSDAEVDHLVALLRLQPGARVLDLCCGQGRHASRLAQRGLSTLGLDFSDELLALARTQPGGSGPRWVRADARALPLRPAFDAVLCLYNSLSFARDADSAAVLRQARAALVSGGQLVLDTDHRDRLARLEPRLREWRDLGEARLYSDRTFDPIDGIADSTLVIERKRPDGTVDARERRLRYRAFSATELKRMVAEAGFSDISLYGEYDRRPFKADSPLLLLHARAGYQEL